MIYVGTVNNSSGSIKGNGKGIYVIDDAWQVKDVLPCDNAGIITISKDHKHIYTANESKDFGGMNGTGGGVSAFAIKEDGNLSFLNDSIAYGSRTAYVDVSEDGHYLLAANHGSHTTVTCKYVKDDSGTWVLQRGFDDSNIALFSLNADGSINQLEDLVSFDGSGYWCYGGGQSTSHIHSVKTRNNLIFACNRGADEIEVLKIEDHHLKLLNRYQTRPGYAPRHIDFHPIDSILYVVNENYPSLSVYRYDESGQLQDLGLYPTMPKSYYEDRPLPSFSKRHAEKDEVNTCGFADRKAAMPSDIHVSKDGQYVYVSNRYYDKGIITIFKVIDDALEVVDYFKVDGNDPRGFAVNEEYILVSLLDQNKIQVFSRDGQTGKAIACIKEIEIPAPSSIII